MPKLAREMGAMEVSKTTAPGLHFVGVVPGLALQVTASGARSWVLRVVIAGRRRDMGLGAYPSVTLALAHAKAREARESIRQGIDPIEKQQQAQATLRAAVAAALSFEECASSYIKAHRVSWKSAKHAQQWENTLAQHANPIIGALRVRDVELPHVLKVLEQPADPAQPEGPSLWVGKTETASRLRGRIEQVLDWAAARGYRSKENPARWRGHLDKILPAPSKVAKVEHHPAVKVSDVGAFMLSLRQAEGMGARALEFAILTAARSGEVRGATWAEIDLKAKLWTVPAARMKAGKEHRVPLSDAAVNLLKSLAKNPESEYLFTAPRGGQLSDMTLTAVLRRMGETAVPHGFRSTFRDWAADRTTYPREVCEMALAHTVAEGAEAAYWRSDLFEKRRRMMDDWAAFLSKEVRHGQVIDLPAKRVL